MSVTYEQLAGWRPGQLGTAATLLTNRRKSLMDLQTEFDACNPPDSWDSLASVQANARHRRLRNSLNDIVAPLSHVIGELDSAEAMIRAAKQTATTAHDAATAQGLAVGEGSTVLAAIRSATGTTQAGEVITVYVGSTQLPKGADGQVLDEAAMNDHCAAWQTWADDICQALVSASDADHALARVLRQAKNNKYDGGTGSMAGAALPPSLRDADGNPLPNDELVQKIADHPERYVGYLDLLTPSQRQEIRDEIAERAANDPGLIKRLIDRFTDPVDLAKGLAIIPASGSEQDIAAWLGSADGNVTASFATWMTYSTHGGFVPQIGAHSGEASAWVRALRHMDPKSFGPMPGDEVPYKTWDTTGKLATKAGSVLAGGLAGYEQWQEDSNDPTLSTSERVGRATTVGASTGLGAYGGAVLGTEIGASIGSVFPGPGTAIGAVAGGLIGGVAGSEFGGWVGDRTKDAVGDLVDGGTKVVSGAIDKAGDIADDVGDAASDVGDALTFWD